MGVSLVPIPLETKVGEYGKDLRWTITYPDGTAVDDLLTAELKLYLGLNDEVTEHEIVVSNPTTGEVSWIVPEGAFDSVGTAHIEIEVTYDDGRFITNTFKEKIIQRVKKDEL